MDLRRIIQEIESDENKRRKADHQKRFHVFNDYQREYVLKMLTNEFSQKTVSEMRTCTSINLSRRIIQEMASIYKREPDRDFSNVSEQQHEGIEMLYEAAKANVKLKKANQKYKLHDQCALQVIPQDGYIGIKVLAPHQYDVIPSQYDPEVAAAYVISTFDKRIVEQENSTSGDVQGNYYGSKNSQLSDGVNQEIGDEDDYQEAQKRYIIWTKDVNIVCDGQGRIIEQNTNPIGILPFVDIASEKDFEFWVRRGSSLVDFQLDFSVTLSDTVNTNRLQSYAQPVIVAEKVPESVSVGPQHILFLPLDPSRPDVKPSFDFASPNPDMKSSLDLQDRLVSYFLTAQGIDPKIIGSSGEGMKFASGLERLLHMIERFEASQDDLDLFYSVEEKLYQLFKAWYQAISGTPMLDQKYNFGAWPDSAELSIKFASPEMVQTEAEKQDSVIKLMDAGLLSKEEAIMQIRNVDQEKAKEILSEIDKPLNMEA